ncbi:MAG: site-specific DNA-methyltransferase [Phycisphaeraceae bacterium]|nr:MAG: site-specific DNA-methyltransferase [Phycisphaeraceae bacterium]
MPDASVSSGSKKQPKARSRVAKPHAASKVAAPRVRGMPEAPAGVRVEVGDCRAVLPTIGEVSRGEVDLIFADPPFNWSVPYERWEDTLSQTEYLSFTYEWLGLCVGGLRAGGALWVNIPDDWAAEIVVDLKGRGMEMVNWCVWHYRFGQNNRSRFISSKVHALYFVKPGGERTFNASAVAEPSDRALVYGDRRTLVKRDGMPPGMRVPMDVWYGKYWGRIQGNNKERRSRHHNQLPEVYLERVVRACSNEGDVVLDPFLGSGTTGVVAHALGRRFIGVEFSAGNAASALERIRRGPMRALVGSGGEGSAIFPARRRLEIPGRG